MTFEHELIIVILNEGHTDLVMDAARSAGAGGGTVLHAKGTAAEEARKFLGVALAAEKEMILLLLRQEARRPVMKAIMDRAGVRSPAHTILFSMPVEDIAGMKSMMREDAGA